MCGNVKVALIGREALDKGYISKAMYPVLGPRLRTSRLPQIRVERISLCDSFEAEDYGDYRVSLEPTHDTDEARYSFVKRDSQQRTDLYNEAARYDFNLSAQAYDASKTAQKTYRMHGAVLTLWAPVVLNKSRTYLLDLSGVEPPIASLRGTLKNNSLTFKLPPFVIEKGGIARGTISKEL